MNATRILTPFWPGLRRHVVVVVVVCWACTTVVHTAAAASCEDARRAAPNTTFHDVFLNQTVHRCGATFQHQCSGAITHVLAENYCRTRWMRLCTSEELRANIPAGTGCGYDLRMVWSANACTTTGEAMGTGWWTHPGHSGWDELVVDPARHPPTTSLPEAACRAEDDVATTRCCAEPRTDAPTTDAPRTTAEPTDAPRTDAPRTTAEPTEESSDAPTTAAPRTAEPTTDAPRTDAPTTAAPTEESSDAVVVIAEPPLPLALVASPRDEPARPPTPSMFFFVSVDGIVVGCVLVASCCALTTIACLVELVARR